MSTPKSRVCPACGGRPVETIVRSRSVEADDGSLLSFEEESSRCLECEEEFYTRAQSLAASRASAGALRQREGLLTPEEIRQLRARFGFTQAQLEQALRIGPKTVVRWEKGTVRQSHTADELMRAMSKFPGVVADLVARHGVRVSVPLPPSVSVNGTAISTFEIALPVRGEWKDIGHVGEAQLAPAV